MRKQFETKALQLWWLLFQRHFTNILLKRMDVLDFIKHIEKIPAPIVPKGGGNA